MERNIDRLKKIMADSNYTVVISGSGMLEEGGVIGIKKPERAYEIESAYGASPEEIFSSVYFTTRPERFFEFYKNEILSHIPEPGLSSAALAKMEKEGKIHCIITANIYDQERRGGCENVINLHGCIFENRCPHCGEHYSIEELRDARNIPHCRSCKSTIRPMVSLFGEMVDSRIMTRTTEEIERAEVLLLLGTTMRSEVFTNYIRYFNGSCLAVIHKEEDYLDHTADLVILDEPGNVLQKLAE